MTNISEDILVRFRSSQCDERELEQIRQWLSESPENAGQLFGMEDIDVQLRENLENEKSSQRKAAMYSRITRRIAIEEGIERAKNRRHRRLLWGMGISAAAVVALIVTVVFTGLFHHELPMVKIVAEAAPLDTVLPDGSHVWLNKYTTIEYPEQFADNRTVNLSGEAYFEVARDTVHPFRVEGSHIDATVLGTKFTFSSNSGNAFSFVSLVEGSVKVSENDGDECVILRPGQKAVYNPSEKILAVNEADTPLDAVWHDNNIPFRNATLRQIAAVLEQLYDMKIHVSGDVNDKTTYSGAAVRYESIDTTLSKLTHTLPISYRIVDGEVWISAKK